MHAHMHAAAAHIAPPLWRLWQAWVRDFHTVAMPSAHAYTEHFRFNRPGYAKCCTMKARAAKVLASTHNTAQSDSAVQGTAPCLVLCSGLSAVAKHCSKIACAATHRCIREAVGIGLMHGTALRTGPVPFRSVGRLGTYVCSHSRAVRRQGSLTHSTRNCQ